ncbi:MAG: YggS family pyridoxal phosphate-dependent enzyme [Syntrophomonadaceae bacterium]|nr:YggS family pyridoxal phosphate-dependent enzyme [Syntrophomonadaceae bacterium]
MSLKDNLAYVKRNIERAAFKVNRDPAEITLVAVSKTVEIDAIREVYALGQVDFGENRVQALKPKSEALPEARWHMIGQLQTNKVRDVVGSACLIHSLDRWNLAEEIDRQARLKGIRMPVLMEINIAGEEQKAGIEPVDVESFLDAIGQLRNIQVQGFMTMAPLSEDPEQARPVFNELKAWHQRLKACRYKNVDLRWLSMGMSQDYEVAIQEGANIIRVGTAIFH